MADNYSDRIRVLLNLLNKLSARPQIAFRGCADRAVDRVRVVGPLTLTATTYSLEVAAGNLARPEIAAIVGTNGYGLTSVLQGVPNFNPREATYLPNSYFLQHVAHRYNSVTIQIYEKIVLNSQPAGFTIIHPLRTWGPILTVLDPVLRTVRECPFPMPEGSSDRFPEPIH